MTSGNPFFTQWLFLFSKESIQLIAALLTFFFRWAQGFISSSRVTVVLLTVSLITAWSFSLLGFSAVPSSFYGVQLNNAAWDLWAWDTVRKPNPALNLSATSCLSCLCSLVFTMLFIHQRSPANLLGIYSTGVFILRFTEIYKHLKLFQIFTWQNKNMYWFIS